MLSRFFPHRIDPLVALTGVALVVAAGFVLFWNLGAHSISLRSDEVIYVRVSQPVLQDNAWFPLRHGKIPFFEKPPLKLWLGALIPALIGESTFSYRALDALLGTLILILTVCCSKQIFGTKLYGLLAGIVMLGAFEFTASHHGLRRAVLDGMIVALTLGSALLIYPFCRNESAFKPHSTRALLGIGLLCGLGVLTKSVAGLLPIAWFGTYLLLAKRGQGLINVILSCFLPAIVIGALYYLPVCLLYSRATETLFGAELFQRIFEGIEGHNTNNPTFYLRFLLRGGVLPPVLLIAGTCFAFLLFVLKDKRFLFVGIWAYGPLVLFSLSSSKVPWYLHPSIPFLSLLCVAAFCELPARLSTRSVRAACTCACVILATVSLFQWEKLMRRVTTAVLAQNNRIDVELLVDHVRQDPTMKVVVVDSILSFRSNPKKGRFNVEGFYANFIRDRIEQITSDQLQLRDGEMGNSLLLIPTTSTDKAPSGSTSSIVVPAFGQRFEPMTVFAYGTATLPLLPHREEVE